MVKPPALRGGDGAIFSSARAYDEYIAMFDLTAKDLARPILDCAAGAASFAADATRAGARVKAVDPLYGCAWERVEQMVLAGVCRAVDNVAAEPERYDWSRMGDPAHHREIRLSAAHRFLRDLREHPDRYVAGSLPSLPFGTAQFELATCSHLLFTYSDALDKSFHIAALREMLRVVRCEVRVFPVVGYYGDASALLGDVMSAMEDDGFTVRVQPVAYRFQRHATEMLRVTRR